MPQLPPLTRCNQESRFLLLWKRAKPVKCTGTESSISLHEDSKDGQYSPRPLTSRGTQRLYIRINTLYYLHSCILSLGQSLVLSSHNRNRNRNHHLAPSDYFGFTLSTVQSAVNRVSEVAAYRLIFLDTNRSFYGGLYSGDIGSSRIQPALHFLKKNLTFLVAVLTDKAQPGAVREVMKATFEAFLMVVLAGGSERAFSLSDYEAVSEDFRSLKRLFCSTGEGLVGEDVVDREAEVAEGVISLMGSPTERLIEEFTSSACDMFGLMNYSTPPMPPTTARWSRDDPNTVLRVLCHRNDDVANQFLKKMYELPKRK